MNLLDSVTILTLPVNRVDVSFFPCFNLYVGFECFTHPANQPGLSGFHIQGLNGPFFIRAEKFNIGPCPKSLKKLVRTFSLLLKKVLNPKCITLQTGIVQKLKFPNNSIIEIAAANPYFPVSHL